MPKAVFGVLVECDPAIRAIIMKIDQEASHSYVVEDLDDQHVVVVEERLPQLKAKLDEILASTQMQDEVDPSSGDD